MTNAINESFFVPAQGQPKTGGSNILGKDDFLRLLITQLQNQDPASPMDDKEFIAQMAQFSSLEQMTNMSNAFQKFVTMQTSQTLVSHSELIGKKVTWEHEMKVDEHQTRIQENENIVKSIKLDKDGSVSIQLDNGMWIRNSQLVQVSNND
ncbi:flagellar hook assembly protein FlgD [Bacillus alkalicellulosilyticus]|uniref:flagellar hook assembly protein FlgD n=1 Tax=Alkalihalobacterium alkalicellulosilyticum TaxID=1912214 RepID=UPI0009975366|nr:flagellar hook assembly protein FlgD [Bacillus alkalicellulosilyticus]